MPASHTSPQAQEWLDALDALIAREGVDQAHTLLAQLIDSARQHGMDVPFSANTPYINTIPEHLKSTRLAT